MKKQQAKPGSALRRIAIVVALCLFTDWQLSLWQFALLAVFGLWLLHQADCCWKCLFCRMARDLAAWGFKRYRRERNKAGSTLFPRMYGMAYQHITQELEKKLVEILAYHRKAELLLRRTIPLRYPARPDCTHHEEVQS